MSLTVRVFKAERLSDVKVNIKKEVRNPQSSSQKVVLKEIELSSLTRT